MSPTFADRPDHAREIRHALTDARTVCERLGLLGAKGSFRRQAAGVIVRCPWHDDRTPSCSVRRGRDGTLSVRCHGCGQTGDVLSLVAAVHRLNLRGNFHRVLIHAAEVAGLHGIVRELETGRSSVERPPIAPPAPMPERDYPPLAEVRALWEACTPVTNDDAVSAWLATRGLEPDLVAGNDLARALPSTAPLPRWAGSFGEPWTATGHRLLVLMRDPAGEIRSVRAARVHAGDGAKRLTPAGQRATGLVMACAFATAMLTGTYQPRRLLVVEGEPDFLVGGTWRMQAPTACIGLVNGSWSTAFAARVPVGTTVYVFTDRDDAGHRYAGDVVRGLQRARGCQLFRWGEKAALTR